MSRTAVLDDAAWARVEPLLPSSRGCLAARFGITGRWSRGSSTGIRRASRGGIRRRSTGRGRRCGRGTAASALEGTCDRLLSQRLTDADAAGEIDWQVSGELHVARVHKHGVTARRSRLTPTSHTGARANDKRRRERRGEPDDHGIDRSRGGLTTKTHALVDGRCRPLVLVCTPGQAG